MFGADKEKKAFEEMMEGLSASSIIRSDIKFTFTDEEIEKYEDKSDALKEQLRFIFEHASRKERKQEFSIENIKQIYRKLMEATMYQKIYEGVEKESAKHVGYDREVRENYSDQLRRKETEVKENAKRLASKIETKVHEIETQIAKKRK